MRLINIMCLAILCLICFQSTAQTKIKESINFKPGQNLNLSFKYPKIVKISTWDQNVVEITGEVNINNGQHDDAFEITAEQEDDLLFISSNIKNHDDLPKMKVLIIGDTYYYFDAKDSEQAIKKLKEEKGTNQNTYSMFGVIKEIQLEIKIPRNANLSVDAKHGLVELQSINAPVKVNSKFGGIDISIPESARKSLELSTRFGEIYTNMDLDLDNQNGHGRNHWEVVKGTLNGGGITCELESKFGNIYVRKNE